MDCDPNSLPNRMILFRDVRTGHWRAAYIAQTDEED